MSFPISFEFYPPKTDEQRSQLDRAAAKLKDYAPEYVSCTFGAGGSTLAHNVAWAISQSLRQDVLILDLDLAFGTVGLNFNQDPPHGIADALNANQKMDQVMLDRLMSKAANHVSLLTAPVVLDRTIQLSRSLGKAR